jgi:hypothetical protein
MYNDFTRFPIAFRSASYSCSIVANPHVVEGKQHSRVHLGLALDISLGCLLAGLIVIAFACIRKGKWFVNKRSRKEEEHMFGPFSFGTNSFTRVVDVKLAKLVPMVMFKKTLLNMTFVDLLNEISHFYK